MIGKCIYHNRISLLPLIIIFTFQLFIRVPNNFSFIVVNAYIANHYIININVLSGYPLNKFIITKVDIISRCLTF